MFFQRHRSALELGDGCELQVWLSACVALLTDHTVTFMPHPLRPWPLLQLWLLRGVCEQEGQSGAENLTCVPRSIGWPLHDGLLHLLTTSSTTVMRLIHMHTRLLIA